MRERNIILFAIGFLLVLTIMFLWKDISHLTFTEPINDSKFYNYFASLGAVGTLVTVIYISQQITESRTSRIASVHPELYPAQSEFVVSDSEPHPFTEAVSIFTSSFSLNGQLLVPTEEVGKVELKNIGLQAAKDIKISWNYDVAKIRKVISGKYKPQETNIPEQYEYSFVTPEKSIKIELPYFYLHSVGNQIAFLPTEPLEIPELKLKITYRDILNNEYENNFTAIVDKFHTVTMNFKSLNK